MTKAGRKRKEGVRTPSGQLSRAAKAVTENTTPAAVRRLRDASLARMVDPEWGTEIGRLYLNERITPVQYAAAKRYWMLHEAYRVVSGFPAPRPRSIDLDAVGGMPVDPDTDQGQLEAERAMQLRADMSDARSVVLAAGSHAWPALVDAIERDRACAGMSDVHWLTTALDALAKHWRLEK